MPTILSRLKAIRESKFLTQRALSDRSGVAQSTIVRLEGGAEAQISTALKLAEALAVEPAQLAGSQTVDESSRHDVWGADLSKDVS